MARACLDTLAGSIFDLVISDVWLPGMDGLETLSRIQEIPEGDRPVVVMISGHGTIDTAVKATKLGAYDFLEKPLSIDRAAGGKACAGASPAAAGECTVPRIRERAAAHRRRQRAHEGAAPATRPDGRD